MLVVLGEMVCQVLGREDMDDNGKATREQFLDRLQQHVHDINAFVRSKVLQIWLKLFKEQVSIGIRLLCCGMHFQLLYWKDASLNALKITTK